MTTPSIFIQATPYGHMASGLGSPFSHAHPDAIDLAQDTTQLNQLDSLSLLGRLVDLFLGDGQGSNPNWWILRERPRWPKRWADALRALALADEVLKKRCEGAEEEQCVRNVRAILETLADDHPMILALLTDRENTKFLARVTFGEVDCLHPSMYALDRRCLWGAEEVTIWLADEWQFNVFEEFMVEAEKRRAEDERLIASYGAWVDKTSGRV